MQTNNETAQTRMPLDGDVIDKPKAGTNQIKDYNATEAGLNALREKYEGVVFEVATTKGDKEARAARQELVKLRTGLEAKRKDLKKPALDYAKLIDTEAARIETAIKELELPIDAQIKAQEKIEADAKAERERIAAEAKAADDARIAGIKAQIEGIRTLPFNSRADSLDDLQSTLADLDALDTADGTFEEFAEEAEAVITQAMTELLGMVETATQRASIDEALRVEREALAAAQKKLDDDAAELAALRAEKAARESLVLDTAETAIKKIAWITDGPLGTKQEAAPEVSPASFNVNIRPELPLDANEVMETFAELGDTLHTMLGDNLEPVPDHIRSISALSGKQFQALARKAAAAGFEEFAGSLLIVGQQLINGDFDAQITKSDLSEFYSADADLVNISRDEMDAIEPHLGE